ncbi:carbohydrate ABC transporter permease [Anaerocolumna sp. AGMB13025]|uniref:carbohydrate ABC transporter permease n=1 Tax=Anaerocolumna sp. AGMB13025 TaxID=3039116 RepID=UPI00241CFEDC|nr:carbohydrate ABC transporter permease [Anaerocolumna sp. AGMB13025]WFR57629.1 carbohydrate ABC transporter permease [Anaerocolumna sp. AGMB13025]
MKTREDKIFQTSGHIVMMLLSACAIIPIVLLVISSFTDNDTLIRNGYSFWPEKLSFYAYEYIFRTGNSVVHAYGISILLTSVGVVSSLVITTMLAYTISKKYLPGKGILTFLVFFTLLFNGGLVPTYMNYTNTFGIKNTFWGLLIPSLLMNGFNVLLMKSYFVTGVPDEILEAAYIDGASEFKTFYRVALPLAKPVVATIGLFAGIAYWNDWQNGYIYLTKRTDLYSIQNLLNRMIQNIQFLSQNSANISNANVGLAAIPSVSVRMAIAVIGILPIILIYPLVQNNFVKGITLGGVKG